MHSEDPRSGFLTNRHHFTAPTPSRKSAGYGHSFFRIQNGNAEPRTVNA